MKEQDVGKRYNFEQGIEEGLKSAKETLKNLLEKIVKNSPPERTDTDGGLYTGSAGIAYAFLHLSERENFEFENHSKEYLQLAVNYLRSSLQHLERRNYRPDSSFLLGKALQQCLMQTCYI